VENPRIKGNFRGGHTAELARTPRGVGEKARWHQTFLQRRVKRKIAGIGAAEELLSHLKDRARERAGSNR